MRVLREILGQQGWPGGVVPSADATLLGPAASPRGLNSALAYGQAGIPYVQKRMGAVCVNSTQITGAPAIIGQYLYNRLANSTTYQVVVSDTGRVDLVNADGTTTTISTGLTAGSHYPDFAVANDLLFLVNGVDAKKWDGTSFTTFGITRPTVGTMAGAAGAAGSPNGTYELRVTYGNSSTGTESSASNTATATVTVVSQKINVSNVPVSADSQVDTRYVYIRNTATMTSFLRAGTIADNSSTTITLDFVDANLITLAPSTTENNPPPSGIKYLAFHQGRLFAATSTAVYYSAINKPESFDPLNVEYVDQSSGQAIRGLTTDHEILIIFKEDRTYGLYNGNDPATWEIRLISGDFGCASHRTIVTAMGWTLWWSRHGLIRWDGAATPDPIGLRLYGDPSDRVSYLYIATASATKDELNARYLVALPYTGQQEANFILPFNLLLGVFESDRWDPMDIASLGEGIDSYGFYRAYVGGYKGQLFRLWESNNDGVATGTTATGTFVASGATITGLTDSGAAFDTTGGGLIERKVTILDSTGKVVTSFPRPTISTNAATTLTFSQVTGLVSGATYTYYVGGPDFQWDTTWRTFDDPFLKKRFEYLWTLIKGVGGADSKIDIAFDWDSTNANGLQRTFTISTAVGLWDDPNTLWDSAVWDAPVNIEDRFRIARVGRAYRVRFRNSAANQPFAMLMVSAQAAAETFKK